MVTFDSRIETLLSLSKGDFPRILIWQKEDNLFDSYDDY